MGVGSGESSLGRDGNDGETVLSRVDVPTDEGSPDSTVTAGEEGFSGVS